MRGDRKRDQGPEFITRCPECGAELVRYEGEAAWYCPNDTACPPQIKGRIEHYISRRAMNIDSLGPETVDDYYRRGLIRDVADLYDIQVQQINGEDGTREIRAKDSPLDCRLRRSSFRTRGVCLGHTFCR